MTPATFVLTPDTFVLTRGSPAKIILAGSHVGRQNGVRRRRAPIGRKCFTALPSRVAPAAG